MCADVQFVPLLGQGNAASSFFSNQFSFVRLPPLLRSSLQSVHTNPSSPQTPPFPSPFFSPSEKPGARRTSLCVKKLTVCEELAVKNLRIHLVTKLQLCVMKFRIHHLLRRYSLEEWITKLLSDIDVSRSAPVASFLELEAAARSSFQDANQQSSEANLPINGMVSFRRSSGLSVVGSSSITPDYGSDNAYEISKLGTPRGRVNISEIGLEVLALDQDTTTPIQALVKYGISNIDSGLFTGETILEQLEGFPRHKMHGKEVSNITDRYPQDD